MSDSHEPEMMTPAEHALEVHLDLLRSDAPTAPPSMDRQIIRRVRWQRSARRPLLIIGHFAATFLDGLRLLVSRPDHR